MPHPYYHDDASGITIYHGDCREVLPTLDIPADWAVVIDPPYGISHNSNYGATWAGNVIANDESTEVREWVIRTFAPRPMFVFGTWKVAKPTGTRQTLIWDKGPAFGMGDLSFPWKNSFEEIYVLGEGFAGRRDEAVLRGHIVPSWESHGRRHQHEKPVSLMAVLIGKCPAASGVVDPTCGTGPSLRAAKDAGLKAIGCEVEERYCEIAAKRLAQGCLFGLNEGAA